MKDFGKIIIWLAGLALLITLFWIFMLPLFTAGKVVDRRVQKYDAETSAQVYDNSRVYQQGTNKDIARYCEQMRSAPNPTAKKAVAALIRSTVSTYEGPLSADNQACVAEAQGN